MNDYNNALRSVKIGMRQLATKIVGPNALVQGALPAMLKETPPEFFQRSKDILARNAAIVCEEISNAPGLKPVGVAQK